MTIRRVLRCLSFQTRSALGKAMNRQPSTMRLCVEAHKMSYAFDI